MKDKFNNELGRIPPNAIDLEEVVLGAIMLEKNAIYEVAQILKIDDFYKYEHQLVYAAIIQMFKISKAIDILTVTEELLKMGTLEKSGGPIFVTKLTSNVGSAAHIEFHAKVIKDKSIARKIIAMGSAVVNMGYDATVDVSDIIDHIEEVITNVVGSTTQGEAKKVGDIGKERLLELEEMSESESDVVGIPSGKQKLDRITSGWQAPSMITIGARPAMGKTRFVLDLAMHPASLGTPVLMYSLEMSGGELFDPMLSIETGIENGYIRRGKFTSEDWEKISIAQRKLENMPIYIDDNANLNMIEFKAKTRRKFNELGIKLVIIDYLQLMSGTDNKKNREAEISEISRTIKKVAKELNVPVIALSQLNRTVETRAGEGKRPQLSDLRESGSIEQDSDIVAFIHRPDYYGIEEIDLGIGEGMQSTEGLIQFIIAKNRHGMVGDVNLWRNTNWTKIFEKKHTVGQSELDLITKKTTPF